LVTLFETTASADWLVFSALKAEAAIPFRLTGDVQILCCRETMSQALCHVEARGICRKTRNFRDHANSVRAAEFAQRGRTCPALSEQHQIREPTKSGK